MNGPNVDAGDRLITEEEAQAAAWDIAKHAAQYVAEKIARGEPVGRDELALAEAVRRAEISGVILAKSPCLANAALDEPVFTLRGKDMSSADLVDLWANRAEKSGARPEKVQGARDIATAMRNYSPRKWPT